MKLKILKYQVSSRFGTNSDENIKEPAIELNLLSL
jgi:hypothetical protein